jgi:hypothetical protein
MTDDGPIVSFSSPFKIAELELPKSVLILPFGMTRSQCIKYLKTFDYLVSTTVDNDPIITDLHRFALKLGTKSIEEIELEQKVVDGDDWYRDELGLEVYAYSFLSIESHFKDLRHD